MRFGFRCDPLTFPETERSVHAAAVRTAVLGRPNPEDAERLRAVMDGFFAEQRYDGCRGDAWRGIAQSLLQVLDVGCSPDRPEAQALADAMLTDARAGRLTNDQVTDPRVLQIYVLHSLCRLGRGGEEEVAFSLRWYLEHQDEWNDPERGCPWTPAVFWQGLWAGRHLAAVEGTIGDGMRRVTAGMNAAGCNSYNDPWGFTAAAGEIDTPEARALILKQVPMILRGQQPDGGWGPRTFRVLRALQRHELLEPLRDLPPLPPDWTVAHSIPAPQGKLFSLAWDGEVLWTYDQQTHDAVAVAPGDGREIRRIHIEDAQAITWGMGSLFATRGDAKELLRIDPRTGNEQQRFPLKGMHDVIAPAVVGDRVYVGDGFLGNVSIFDPEHPEPSERLVLAGPGPACLAADDDSLWHADFWAPAIIRSDLRGKLLEWGDQPFPVRGLACDGERLWALDESRDEIRVLKRTSPDPA